MTGTTRRSGRITAAATAVALVAMLAGCGGGGGAPDAANPAPGPPTDVRAEVMQDRVDIARGLMQIRVHNDGPEPVEVLRASYADPRFATTLEAAEDRVIPAGSYRDLRAPIPAPDCDAGTGDEASASAVFLVGGEEAAVDLPVSDPFDFVPMHTAEACAQEHLLAFVSLTIDDVSREGTGDEVVGVVRIRAEAVGDRAVTVGPVDGTVLLLAVDEPVPAVVRPGEEVVIEHRIRPARCDPHVIAEDKVGTLLPVSVGVEGGGPEGQLILAADPEQKGEIFDIVALACGW